MVSQGSQPANGSDNVAHVQRVTFVYRVTFTDTRAFVNETDLESLNRIAPGTHVHRISFALGKELPVLLQALSPWTRVP